MHGAGAVNLAALVPAGLAPAEDETRRCYGCAWWHRARQEWAIGECGKHRRSFVPAEGLQAGPSVRVLVSTPRWYHCPAYEERAAVARKE